MSTNINGYILNDVKEPAGWSPVEKALLTTIVGKQPDAGSRITASSRHAHAVLISPNEAIDPVLSFDNSGNGTMLDGATLNFGGYGYVKSTVGTASLDILTAYILNCIATGDVHLQSTGGDVEVTVTAAHGLGVHCLTAPNAVLEVSDGATSKSMVVKITQDNQDVPGLIIGNDAASTTDTDGLRLIVQNDADCEIKNTNTGSLYLNTACGDVYLQVGGTTFLSYEIVTSKLTLNNAPFITTIKAGANQGAAGAAAGELWQDTDDNTIKIGV